MCFLRRSLTGKRQMTSTAFLTFVAIDRDGAQVPVPPLVVETEEERRVCDEAHARRDRAVAAQADGERLIATSRS